jgi:hypothetical protein
MTYEVSSTSPEALHHDDTVQSNWHLEVSRVTDAIASVLEPQTLLVEMHHTIEDIERILGITGLAPSLLLGVKSLRDKTLVYHNGHVHVQESGTKFAVRAAQNNEQYALAA